mgnify:CR=1 FL=1
MLLVLSMLSVLGAMLLWYASCRHQRILRQPLAKGWRYLAAGLFCSAVVAAAQQLSQAATVFFCLLMLMLSAALIPFATLLSPQDRHGR